MCASYKIADGQSFISNFIFLLKKSIFLRVNSQKEELNRKKSTHLSLYPVHISY